MGKTARTESARLILDFTAKETNDLPVILTGDFNRNFSLFRHSYSQNIV